MLKVGKILTIIAILGLVANTLCFAEGVKGVNVTTKLKGGLINLVTGVMEIPKQVSETYNDTNNITGALTIGLFKGIIRGVGRTVAGAIDTVLFFMPPYDKPLMEPLYKI